MSDRDSHGKPRAPDGAWGWMCVLGAVLTHIIFGILVRSFGVTYLEMLNRYQAGAMATGWVGAINMTASGLFGPLTTSLCVKYTARKVTIVGGVILSAGIILTGISPNIPVVYITYGFISGLGLSMTYTPGYLSVGEYFDKRKSLAMAVCNLGTGFGTVVFPPLILYLFRTYGYGGSFLILGGTALNCCVGGALFRPLEATRTIVDEETTRDQNQEHLNPIYKNPAGGTVQNITRKQLNKQAKTGLSDVFDSQLLRNGHFLCMCTVVFSCAFALALTSGFLPALAVDKGIDTTRAAFLLSISGISSTFGGLGFGIPLDFKLVRPYRITLYGLFALMVGVATIFNPLCSSYLGFVCFTIFRAMFAGVIIGQRATLVADFVGAKQVPNAFGWLLFAHSLGSLIGRASGGTLKDVLGSYDSAFYLSGAVSVLACLIYIVGTKDKMPCMKVSRREELSHVVKYSNGE